MRQSILSLALILSINTFASATNSKVFPNYLSLELEQLEIEDKIFSTSEETVNNDNNVITIDSIEVIELEEEIDIDFDTTEYLPEGFNALDGKNDINWDEIELVELNEEVELGFDTKDYLPKGFNPYKGMQCKTSVAFVSIH